MSSPVFLSGVSGIATSGIPASGSDASGPAKAGRSTSASAEAVQYAKMLLGWTLVLVLIAAISHTRFGQVVLYYALLMAILIVVLGSYQEVVDILGTVRAPAGPSSGGPNG